MCKIDSYRHNRIPVYDHVEAGNDGFKINCLAPVIVQDFFNQLHNTNDILTVQGCVLVQRELQD